MLKIHRGADNAIRHFAAVGLGSIKGRMMQSVEVTAISRDRLNQACREGPQVLKGLLNLAKASLQFPETDRCSGDDCDQKQFRDESDQQHRTWRCCFLQKHRFGTTAGNNNHHAEQDHKNRI